MYVFLTYIIEDLFITVCIKMYAITCLVRGARGVGKTALINALSSGNLTANIPFIKLKTNHGLVHFKAIECLDTDESLQEVLKYHPQIDGVILMFSAFDLQSEYNRERMKEDHRGLPVAICFNGNVDICGSMYHTKCHPYTGYGINTTTETNLKFPFLELARQILKKPDLWFR